MNNRLFEVRQRRNELLTRIASQRDEVAKIGASWQAPLALADQGLGVARFLRSHPLLTTGMAALVAIRRRGVFGLGKLVWRGWRIYRLAKSFKINPPERS